MPGAGGIGENNGESQRNYKAKSGLR